MTSFSRNRQGIETSPSGFRTGQPACQMRQGRAEPDLSSVPTGNQKRLFCYINEISFAVYETLLFLIRIPLTRMPFSISEPAARFGITRWRNTRKRTVPLPSTRPMMPEQILAVDGAALALGRRYGINVEL